MTTRQFDLSESRKQAILAGRIEPDMSFMQKVWAVCARIPQGKVCTYADIAHSLGSKAYRAVGQAMHHNPLAPGVPCHRVVGSTGQLTGFAHGIARKQKMLEQEGITFIRHRVQLEQHRVKNLKRSTRKAK